MAMIGRLGGRCCLLVCLVLVGCVSNTPQQDYVYAMARPCEGRGVKIDYVSTDGKSWHGSWVGGAATWPEFEQCVREQMKLKPYQEWLKGAR